MTFYAHSLEGQPREKWETMGEHEQRVAALYAQFLKRILSDLEPWGDLLGRWHDLGKYSIEWPRYLFNTILFMKVIRRTDHSTAIREVDSE